MATEVLEIPVTNDPGSKFNVELDGNTYALSLRWNITDGAWYLNLQGVTNSVALPGLKLVTGPNLLHPYAEIDLGALYVVDKNDQQRDPDFDNFGDDFLLVYVEKSSDAII